MADPITMAGVSMGLSALGAGVGAAGSLSEGNAKANMYTYQAGVAQINKQVSLQNADYARWAGETEAQQSGMATRYKVGQEKVAQSGHGIDVNFGSAPMVRESEVDIGQQNQAIIRSNAARRAYGFQVEAAGEEAKSTMAQMAASTSKTAGQLGAVKSIIGGASSVAGKWYQGGSVFPSDSGGVLPGGAPLGQGGIGSM